MTCRQRLIELSNTKTIVNSYQVELIEPAETKGGQIRPGKMAELSASSP